MCSSFVRLAKKEKRRGELILLFGVAFFFFPLPRTARQGSVCESGLTGFMPDYRTTAPFTNLHAFCICGCAVAPAQSACAGCLSSTSAVLAFRLGLLKIYAKRVDRYLAATHNHLPKTPPCSEWLGFLCVNWRLPERAIVSFRYPRQCEF